MENIFLKILNISITASWLVLAVLLMRLLLRKAPRYVTVIMWALVGIRLLLPFTFESALSLIPNTEPVPPDILYETAPQVHTGIDILNNTINPVISESFAPAPGASVNPLQVITYLAGWIWVIGMAAMAIYSLISCLRIRRKLREAIPLRDNIYLCDRIDTPFIFGLFRPKIYLPSNMVGADIPLVLAHEQAHLKRRDHLWKPLGFLLLTVYWFNPLMWVAYILLCRDIETACDEKVLKTMGEEIKKPYSQALIHCSVPRKMISACPLAFGEVSVKSRIKKVLNYKKPAFWLLIAAVVACIALSVCFLTNPRTVNEKMQIFLDCSIADHFQSDKSAGNACCVDYEILGTKKRGKTTTVYMWVVYEEYSYEKGQLKRQSGINMLTAITATKVEGNYRLVEHWEPRDGSYYTDDIRAKFPWYLWDKALDSPRYIKQLKEACREMAEEYFKENSYTTPTGSVIHIPNQSVAYDDFGLNMTLIWEDGGTLNAVFQYEPTTSQAGFPTTTQEYQLYAIHDGKRWPIEDYARKVLGLDYPTPEPVTQWTVYTIKAGEQTMVPIELGMELPPGPYELVKEVSLQVGDMRYKKEYSVPFAILDSALTDPNMDAAHKDLEDLKDSLAQKQQEAEVLKLQELYPHYFNTLAETGMTVYVWQMAAGSYSWGLMPTGEEYAWDDFEKLMPFSLEELHAIVNVYGLEKEQVTVCPIQVIHSSYAYNINDAYINNVTTLFWSWQAEDPTVPNGALIDSAVFDIDGDGKEETCTLYDGRTSGVFSFTFSVFEGDKLEYRNTFTAKHGQLRFVRQEDGTMGLGHTLNTDAVKIYSIVLSDGNITLLDGTSVVPYIGLQGVGKYQEYTEYSIIQSAGVAYTVSYAGGGSSKLNGIFQEALNKETFYTSSQQHLPVLKFDTLEELEQFKRKYATALSGSKDGWAEVPSFQTVSLRYNEEFFEDHTLVLVYVPCGNCTHRIDVKHVFSGRDQLDIWIHETTGTEVFADIEANWFVAIELHDTEAESITDYDAVLVTP